MNYNEQRWYEMGQANADTCAHGFFVGFICGAVVSAMFILLIFLS